ncbi:MAG: S8 family serine peptidase [bacterium]
MKVLFWRSFVTVVFVLNFLAIPQMASAGGDDVDVLIGYHKPYNEIVAQIEAVGGTVRHQYKHIDAIAATIPRDKLSDIQGLPDINAFVRDITFSLVDPPQVPRQGFGEVSSIHEISSTQLSGDIIEFTSTAPEGYFPTEVNLTRASDFWSATGHFGEGVIVGIMDTGTADVAAISGRVLGGESFLSVNPTLDDGLGANSPLNNPHGTWVATTLGANVIFGFSSKSTFARSLKTHLPDAILPRFFRGNIDGVPMVGQAPFAQFFALKVFNVAGFTSNSIILAAFDQTIELKLSGDVNIQVLNGSFGGPTLFAGDDPFFAGMVQELQDVGIMTCFSAGNEGPSSMTGGDPGLAHNNLTVGATDVAAYEKILRDLQFGLGIGSLWRANDTHQTVFFSSRGPTADGRFDPDITAPGRAIFAQSASGGLAIVSGTSFSSPMVAGAAALLLSANPDATPDQIRAALLNGANPNVLEDNSGPNDQGFGFLDVLNGHTALNNGAANPADEGIGKKKVTQNIQEGTGINVITENNFSANTGALRPGERAEYFYDIKKTVKRVTVTISNVSPELPPAEQNQLFGDDLLVGIHSAKTSGVDDYRAGTLAFVGVGGATFVLEGSDLDVGIARITISGDWTNAGNISADVNIVQEHFGEEQGFHANGLVAEGGFKGFQINVPSGANELRFRLVWDDDWGMYPTDDLDMFVFPPGSIFPLLLDNDGDFDIDGLSLDSPERLNISNPLSGTWSVFVNGFTVWEGEERFDLFADVVNALPKLASEDGSLEVVKLPTEFQLAHNFPNPFNPTTNINYDLPRESHVSLKIFNVQGQLVRTLVNEITSAGFHSVLWDGRDDSGRTLPSGAYIYQIKAGDFEQTRKMVLLK